MLTHRETDFPEWHSSDSTSIFASPVFRNRKETPGYFF